VSRYGFHEQTKAGDKRILTEESFQKDSTCRDIDAQKARYYELESAKPSKAKDGLESR